MISFVPVTSANKVLSLKGKVSGKVAGRVEMLFDGKNVGALDLPGMWKVEALNAGIRCGENKGAPISYAYTGTNKLDQKLNKVVFSLTL